MGSKPRVARGHNLTAVVLMGTKRRFDPGPRHMSITYLVPFRLECDHCKAHVMLTAACEATSKGKLKLKTCEPGLPEGWTDGYQTSCPSCNELFNRPIDPAAVRATLEPFRAEVRSTLVSPEAAEAILAENRERSCDPTGCLRKDCGGGVLACPGMQPETVTHVHRTSGGQTVGEVLPVARKPTGR